MEKDNTIDLARKESIRILRTNSAYSFGQLKVKANTHSNNGVIEVWFWMWARYYTYTNKCFFISVSQGLAEYEIKVSPSDLAYQCNMINHDLVDTDNPVHIAFIKDMANYYNIKLEIYIGTFQDDEWYTTPDPSTCIGRPLDTSTKIIRILNKGAHFELLTSLEHGFIDDFTHETYEAIILDQHQEMKRLETHLTDLRLAEQLRKEDERLLLEQMRWEEERLFHEEQEKLRRAEEERFKKRQEMDDLVLALKLTEEEQQSAAMFDADIELARKLNTQDI
ncbi:putative ORFan [Tupanvirus deep ocean]|uniref:ORFan n=2 Tax=Tupanvirus TaxID=2094720 RepID=A0AC62A8K6_9VIRU|nr:putative ORFan [Tupanvirus deep ocean]QKU33988.1 putative ORFan [Tupanvirus deep ocean]